MQLSPTSSSVVGEQLETSMVSSLDSQKSPVYRLGLSGARESPDQNSCFGKNSHKSYVDQGDLWGIKFRSVLNLFDLTKR